MSKIFSRSISKEVDNEQCKQLWFRIKGEAKKKHDGKVMSFKRTCAITGGGQAPQPPPDIDGDDIDPLFADECDPNPTPYNKFVTSEERTAAKFKQHCKGVVLLPLM